MMRAMKQRRGSFCSSPDEPGRPRKILQRLKLNSAVSDNSNLISNISFVPEFRPTLEQFADPMSYWESLQEIGIEYGAVKVIPPTEWRYEFALDMRTANFEVRKQHLHRMGKKNVFTFPKDLWTLKKLSEHNRQFVSERYSGRTPNGYGQCPHECETNSSTFPSPAPLSPDERKILPSIQELETEYWQIIEQDLPEKVTVLYAADLESSVIGSGFPNFKNGADEFVAKHFFNLNNIPTSDGSLLRRFHLKVPGVSSPWLYIGTLFSCFCWHTEDNYFPACNYHHWGATKVWYVVPPQYASDVEKVIREYYGKIGGSLSFTMHSLSVQVSPRLLLNAKIPVYKIYQNSGDFVLLWPRTFHAGFNTGINCNEACNVVGYKNWLPNFGKEAAIAYRFQRPSCIPHEQIVLSALCHAHDLKNQPSRLLVLLETVAMIIRDELRQTSSSHIPEVEMQLQSSELAIVQSSSSLGMGKLREFTRELEFCVKVSPTTDFSLERFLAILQLPASDCDNCKGSCHMGFVMCPHGNYVTCRVCASFHTCPETEDEAVCSQRISIRRTSGHSIRKLFDTVANMTTKGDDIEKVIQNTPTLQDITKIEDLAAKGANDFIHKTLTVKIEDESRTERVSSWNHLVSLLTLKFFEETMLDELDNDEGLPQTHHIPLAAEG